MTTKHTPGPWKAEDQNIYAKNIPHSISKKPNNPRVCTTQGASEWYISIEEANANAKLIASAPELLEIAKSSLKYFEEKADHDELSTSEIQQWTKTHEAIEKATK